MQCIKVLVYLLVRHCNELLAPGESRAAARSTRLAGAGCVLEGGSGHQPAVIITNDLLHHVTSLYEQSRTPPDLNFKTACSCDLNKLAG